MLLSSSWISVAHFQCRRPLSPMEKQQIEIMDLEAHNAALQTEPWAAM